VSEPILLDAREGRGYFRDEKLCGDTLIASARYLKGRGLSLDQAIHVRRDGRLIRSTSIGFALREALQIPLAEAA
jgi:hypothetical protein